MRYTEIPGVDELNKIIGFTAPNGEDYKQRAHRPQQMVDYYVTVKSLMKKLSTKRTLYFYDCGCGKGYVSFYLNYLLTRDGYNNIQFICIDMNEKLIERNKATAQQLSFTNMTFFAENMINFNIPHQPDILYSLHACDTATDMMIYKGIAENARHILSVSCCQHTTRKQLKGHPMGEVAKHKPYKEQLTDMISNTLRTLLLEAQGYKVTVFEFTSTTYTAKNIMLKCEKVGIDERKAQKAQREYEKLATLFNVRPALEHYLVE